MRQRTQYHYTLHSTKLPDSNLCIDLRYHFLLFSVFPFFHLPVPSIVGCLEQTDPAKYQYNSTKAIKIKNASSIKNTTMIGISRGSFRLLAPTLASFRDHWSSTSTGSSSMRIFTAMCWLSFFSNDQKDRLEEETTEPSIINPIGWKTYQEQQTKEVHLLLCICWHLIPSHFYDFT